MRLGYMQINRKKGSGERDQDELKQHSCRKIYCDRYHDKLNNWRARPELLCLLDDSQQGDIVVIRSLDQISSHYQVWLEVLQELRNLGLELEVLESSHLVWTDWWQIFSWIKKNDLEVHSTINVTKFSKERTAEKARYSFFSRDAYFRSVYREIFQQVIAKRSLRQIAKESGAPFSTVVRIRKDYVKLKQAVLLISTFLLTIISLKIVQSYSSNILLQVAICGAMTLLIVYYTYSDSFSD